MSEDPGDPLLGETESSVILASEVSAAITHTTCGASTGAIAVTVDGTSGPYTYEWLHGPTTATVSGLASGTYSVTITDSLSDTFTRTFRVGNVVSWVNQIGVSVDVNGAVTKTSATGWTSGAVSSTVLAGSTDGTVSLTITAATSGRFMVGLSDFDTNANYTSIDYALYYLNGSILVYENGVLKKSLGAAAVGDVYMVGRANTNINYYKNGTVVWTGTVSATVPLIVDSSLYQNGSVMTNVTTSFCGAPLAFGATIGSSSCGAATGSIAVNVTAGVAPYTYAWTHGPTTATITNLAVGDYTVKVTDATGRSSTQTFSVTAGATGWARLNGVTYNDTTKILTKTANSGWGNAGGFSAGSIGANANGSVQFSVPAITAEKYMIGLSATDDNDHYDTIDYALYYNAGMILIYENGVYRGGFGTATAGDVYKVAREGSNIRYYRNATVLRTVATTPTDLLFFDFSIYYKNDTIEGVQGNATATCGPPLAVTGTVTQASCGIADGSVSLGVTGGTAPITYAWSNGATTQSITAAAGTYSVTVTDANGGTFEGTFVIGNKIDWATLVGVTYDAPSSTLTKTGLIGWTSGGASADALAASTDGSVSFTLPTLPAGRYFFGLSDTSPDNNYTSIDYALYYISGKVYVYENGVYRNVGSTPVAGDTYRVSREGTTVKYYRNATVLRTTTGALATPLIVDFSIYDPGAQIRNVGASFCTP